MGFTTAAALRRLGARWPGRGGGDRAGGGGVEQGPACGPGGPPLVDHRVTVRLGDVAEILQTERGGFDAILLDVDNGPEGLTRKERPSLCEGRPEGGIQRTASCRRAGRVVGWAEPGLHEAPGPAGLFGGRR
ncbi:MAG: hypothetical protein MZV64_31855 [Ignavibacteriales bacterium]|nr:hypothetical protein [Ignavibacteriales bacterium]